MQFGNEKAHTNISILTSPFCGHCEEPHFILKSLLEKYGERLSISIIFNVNPMIEDFKEITTSLIDIKLNLGNKKYNEAIESWYHRTTKQNWLEKYSSTLDSNHAEQILMSHFEWSKKNDLHFTPCIFVNGYKYPIPYKITDLPFLMNELISDVSYNSNKVNYSIADAEKL